MNQSEGLLHFQSWAQLDARAGRQTNDRHASLLLDSNSGQQTSRLTLGIEVHEYEVGSDGFEHWPRLVAMPSNAHDQAAEIAQDFCEVLRNNRLIFDDQNSRLKTQRFGLELVRLLHSKGFKMDQKIVSGWASKDGVLRVSIPTTASALSRAG